MNIIKDLLGSSAFYAALIALLNALQRYLLPDLPAEIVLSINLLLSIVFAVIAARYTVKQSELRAEALTYKKAWRGE